MHEQILTTCRERQHAAIPGQDPDAGPATRARSRIKSGLAPHRTNKHQRGAIRLPFVCCVTALAVLCCTEASANATTATTTPAGQVAPALRPWVAYLQTLRTRADATAAVRSAQAGTKASQASVDAQEGDRGLSLDGGFVDYPNGAGTGEDGSFTNLDRRGEIRLSWDVLDFFARRPGRIASAKKDVDMAQAGVAVARRQAMQSMMQRSVLAWSASQRRQALTNASQDLEQANQTLDSLRNHALTRQLADEVAQGNTQALELQAQITQASANIPATNDQLPQPPDAYGILPATPPSAETVKQIAQQSPRAAQLRAESAAFAAQERAHWAQNFKVGIYGGYVMQDVRGAAGTQRGPEVGISVSVPIGGGGHGKRANAHWQARQQALAAQDAVDQEQQLLEQIPQQWAQASTSLKSQAALVRHMAKQLNRMQQRSAAGASSKAPERWQLRLASAQFWVAIANLWQTRAQWVDSALTWSLYDGGHFLKSHYRPNGADAAHDLCAPLPACPQT